MLSKVKLDLFLIRALKIIFVVMSAYYLSPVLRLLAVVLDVYGLFERRLLGDVGWEHFSLLINAPEPATRGL